MTAELYEQFAKADQLEVTIKFTKALSAPQSDLATQTLKDPYVFDFLALTIDYERAGV